ncbi:MAG: DUF305 domain-containing protein [Chloracidobacterium sp.]|nr:DUF305 domain-containing protein [Chloracidobacterium sp.]
MNYRPNLIQKIYFHVMIAVMALACVFVIPVNGQSDTKQVPIVVRPGAPGQPTKTLPPSTRAQLPPTSKKDVEFMQGMIMHHAQAVEMVELMDSRVDSKELRLLGARISHSQAEEMRFMERWLAVRGESASMQMAGDMHHHMPGMDMSSHNMLMPGMLTPKQMDALKNAKGKEFDRLFLAGMIQHHEGALVMVKELVEKPGTAQDSEVFNFITDVDSGQRAEIRIMQKMLGKNR